MSTTEIVTDFNPQYAVCVCNWGGYLIEINESQDQARMYDDYGSENPELSDWKAIEFICDSEEDTEEPQAIIDPDGYNIPLSLLQHYAN